MVRAILFYKKYSSGTRHILSIIDDPGNISNDYINYCYEKLPVVPGLTTGNKYKPSLYMNYCGSDYLLKEGGQVDDTENGKG